MFTDSSSSQTAGTEQGASQGTEQGTDPLVSDELLHLMTLANFVILVEVISVFGIVLNVINFAVFIRVGFKDTVNISLLGLTVTEIGSLLPMVWMGLCYNPLLAETYRQVDFMGIQHLTAGWPHVCFTRITACLTVYITLERYLCVKVPLKVKALLTPTRTVLIVSSIFLLVIAGVVPVYCSTALGPVAGANQTLVTLYYFSNGRQTESASVMFAAFVQLASFASVIGLTVGLVTKYKESTKWRHASASSSLSSAMTARDRRTVKMVIFIAAIFIVGFTPGTACIIAMFIFAEFNITGLYRNLFVAYGSFFFCLESVQSGANIFVYFKLSSNFRKTFLKMFRLTRKD